MLFSEAAHRLARKTGSTFPHDALEVAREALHFPILVADGLEAAAALVLPRLGEPRPRGRRWRRAARPPPRGRGGRRGRAPFRERRPRRAFRVSSSVLGETDRRAVALGAELHHAHIGHRTDPIPIGGSTTRFKTTMNTVKTGLLLAALTALFGVVGYLLGGAERHAHRPRPRRGDERLRVLELRPAGARGPRGRRGGRAHRPGTRPHGAPT